MGNNALSADEKICVTLAIEHKEREFASKLLLARRLVNAGARVYLGSTEAIDAISSKLDPAIILHKSTFNAKSKKYRSLGHKFVVLDEEGGYAIPRSRIAEYCRLRYATLSPDKESLILTPNEAFSSEIRSLSDVPAVSTGWPRIELWFQKYWSLWDHEVQAIRLQYGEFLLFTPSFGDITRKYAAGKRENLEHWWDGNKSAKALADYVQLISGLAPRLQKKGIQLVVRPHPSERLGDWAKILWGIENLKIVKRGDVAPWIRASSGVLTWGSGTSVQAAVMGKKVFTYKVAPLPGLTDTISFEIATNVEGPEEILDLVALNRDEKKISEEARSALQNLQYEETGVSPSSRIVEELLSIGVTPTGPLLETRGIKLRLWILNFMSQAHKIFQMIPGFPTRSHQTVAEKIPGGIDDFQVGQLLERIIEAEGGSVSTKIRAIGRNLVMVEG